MANTQPNKHESIELIKDLIDDIETAMLTTHAGERLVSRPMQTQDIEFDGDLWFLTEKDTEKYLEILANPEVNVAYVGKSYVSVSGTAQPIEDLEKKKKLWNKAYEKMLNTTYDDPNVILLKIDTHSAEYWETGNTTKAVKSFLKNIVGNESADNGSSDLNDTVDLDNTGR